MKEWNRKQKAISFISGLIGFSGGFQLGVLEHPLFSLVGSLIMSWGVYFMIRGMFEND